MLLQTNSYIVPREKRAEHAKLLRRFRQTLLRLGCDHFEVYEQVGPNWNTGEQSNRFVQIMRFRDRTHQQDVQNAERDDPGAQTVIAEFCELINFNYQQQQGLFAQGFYTSFMRVPPSSSQQSAAASQTQEIPATTVESSEPPITAMSGDHSQSTESSDAGPELRMDDSDENAAQFGDDAGSGMNEALEDSSNETMIEVESRPVLASDEEEEESEIPHVDAFHDPRILDEDQEEPNPKSGNNGHA